MRRALEWRLPLLVLSVGVLAATSIAGCGPALTVGAIAGISSLDDDDSERPDALPSASVTTPSGTVNDVIALSYRLTDADGDRASIVVEYSRDGTTYQSASQAFVEGAEGTANLTAAAGGSDHVFFWNSTRDLSTENVTGVSLRVRPVASSGAAGVEATTTTFDVFNRFVTTLAAQPSTARVRVTRIARESNGDLILADSNGHRVLRYSLSGGTTDVLAGTGSSGFVGGGIAGEQAQLNLPRAVGVRPNGEILVADFFNLRVRQIDGNEFVSELAGGGSFFGENELGSESFLLPFDLEVDSSGNAYLLSDTRVRVLNLGASDLSFAKGTTNCQQLAQLSALTAGPSRVYSVFAGAPGCGTGASAYTARLFDPLAIALQNGSSGERLLYVLDRGFGGGASNQFPVIRVANLGSSAASVRSLVTQAAVTLQPGDQQIVANRQQLPQIAGDVVDLSVVSEGVLLLPSLSQNRVFAINLTTSAVELAGTSVPGESVTAVAGSGTVGFQGDGGDALAARLSGPIAVASDGQGNVFVSEGEGRLRVFAGAGGFSTPSLTLAAGKTATIPAVLPSATPELVSPTNVTRVAGGDLLITDNVLGDSRSNRVVRLSSSTGELSLVLGGGSFGDGGDGGPAGQALIGQIGRPDISADGGLVVVPDSTHNRVRAVNLGQQARTFLGVTIEAGEVETVVGVGQVGSATLGDGGPANQAGLDSPVACSFDGQGLLWISDQGNHRIRVANPLSVSVEVLGVTIAAGAIQTVVGTGQQGTPSDDGDGGAAGAAKLNRPGALVGPDGNLYVADGAGQPRVRVVNLGAQTITLGGVSVAAGAIETIAFSGATREPDQSNLGDGGNALAATVRQLSGLDVTPGGLLYVSDGQDHRVRVVNLSGQSRELGSLTLANGAVATVLGDGIPGFSGDPSNVGRDLQSAGPPGLLESPGGLVVNDESSLFLLDTGNGALRLANFSSATVGFAGVTAASGQVAVVSGSRSGTVRAEVPQSVVVDSQNLVIFSDSGRIGDKPAVLQLDPDTRIVTRLAGTASRTAPDESNLGDNGRALLATLSDPQGVALDSDGSLYICDAGNRRIRFVNRTTNDVQPLSGLTVRPSDIVTIFNGEGDGDDGNDVGAAINNGGVDMLFPVAVAREGDALWVCDEGAEKLLRLDLSQGTVAGILSQTQVQAPRTGTIQNDGMGRVALTDAGLTFANSSIRVNDTVLFGNREAEVLEIDTTMDRLILEDDNPPGAPMAVTYQVIREFEPTAVAPLSATEAYVGIQFDGFAEVVRVSDQGSNSFSLSSVAGTTSGTWNGDRLAATSMNFAEIGEISRDGDLLYVADPGLNRVVVINTGSSTQTIAGLAVGAGEARTVCGGGQGSGGFNGDALPPEIALLLRPTGVAPSSDGKLVIADQGNARLRSFLR